MSQFDEAPRVAIPTPLETVAVPPVPGCVDQEFQVPELKSSLQ